MALLSARCGYLGWKPAPGTRVPHAELIATIEANAPAMSVRQVVGKTFGKGALADEKTLVRAWDWSVAYASRRGGDWLVIMPKAAESPVAAAAAPPTFIKLAHFGHRSRMLTVPSTRP